MSASQQNPLRAALPRITTSQQEAPATKERGVNKIFSAVSRDDGMESPVWYPRKEELGHGGALPRVDEVYLAGTAASPIAPSDRTISGKTDDEEEAAPHDSGENVPKISASHVYTNDLRRLAFHHDAIGAESPMSPVSSNIGVPRAARTPQIVNPENVPAASAAMFGEAGDSPNTTSSDVSVTEAGLDKGKNASDLLPETSSLQTTSASNGSLRASSVHPDGRSYGLFLEVRPQHPSSEEQAYMAKLEENWATSQKLARLLAEGKLADEPTATEDSSENFAKPPERPRRLDPNAEMDGAMREERMSPEEQEQESNKAWEVRRVRAAAKKGEKLAAEKANGNNYDARLAEHFATGGGGPVSSSSQSRPAPLGPGSRNVGHSLTLSQRTAPTAAGNLSSSFRPIDQTTMEQKGPTFDDFMTQIGSGATSASVLNSSLSAGSGMSGSSTGNPPTRISRFSAPKVFSSLFKRDGKSSNPSSK